LGLVPHLFIGALSFILGAILTNMGPVKWVLQMLLKGSLIRHNITISTYFGLLPKYQEYVNALALYESKNRSFKSPYKKRPIGQHYKSLNRNSGKTDNSTHPTSNASTGKTIPTNSYSNVGTSLTDTLSKVSAEPGYQPNHFKIQITSPFDNLIEKIDHSVFQPGQRNLFDRPVSYRFSPEEYMVSAINRQAIGDAGELFVIEYEKRKLAKANLHRLIPQIVHASKIQGDSAGFDISSFDSAGTPILIEVKTTLGDILSPFLISANEIGKRNSSNNYFIYRVYNFDLELMQGNLYVIGSPDPFDKYFDIQVKTYKMTPNRNTTRQKNDT
jgi:hypothetical protein